jgi:hypothetical protein
MNPIACFTQIESSIVLLSRRVQSELGIDGLATKIHLSSSVPATLYTWRDPSTNSLLHVLHANRFNGDDSRGLKRLRDEDHPNGCLVHGINEVNIVKLRSTLISAVNQPVGHIRNCEL